MFIGGCGELGFAGVQIDRAEVQPIAAFGVQCRLNGVIAGLLIGVGGRPEILYVLYGLDSSWVISVVTCAGLTLLP